MTGAFVAGIGGGAAQLRTACSRRLPAVGRRCARAPPARAYTVRASAVSDAMKHNKMIHVVYRVGDMESTRNFYTQCLGMQVLRERDMPDNEFTNAFFGYGPEKHGEHFSLELTYNYGVKSYNLGNGFSHLGVATPNVEDAVSKAVDAGGRVVHNAGELRGKPGKRAVVEDRDGYRFELIERRQRDPLAQVALRVSDLDKSVDFYTNALGMSLISRTELPDLDCAMAVLGYGPEEDSTTLVLTAYKGVSGYDLGDGYGQLAVMTRDVYAAADAIRKAGFEVSKDPGPVPGIGTKITSVTDPDDYKTVLVDEADFEKEFE